MRNQVSRLPALLTRRLVSDFKAARIGIEILFSDESIYVGFREITGPIQFVFRSNFILFW